MFTVTLDYLENGRVMTCDTVHESLDEAMDCAGQYIFIGECQAVFVTDAFGETVFCAEGHAV